MKCSQCGRELPDDAKFCLECGSPVTAPDAPEADGSGVTAQGSPESSSASPDDAGLEKTTVVGGHGSAGEGHFTEDGSDEVSDPTVDDDAADPSTEETADPTATAQLLSKPRETVVAGETTELAGGMASRTEGAKVHGAPTDASTDRHDGDAEPVDPTKSYAKVFVGSKEASWAHQPTDEFGPVAPAPRLEDEKRSAGAVKGKRALVGVAAVSLAILVALVAFVTWRLEIWGGKTLPDVVGKPLSEATRTLEDMGFTVATKEVVSDDGVGSVVAMEPTGGKRMDGGTVIALSVGVERSVPEVEGMDLADAREALSERGIVQLRLEYQNSHEKEGTVISVAPKEGTVVTADEMVTLVVAQPYTVPDVVGLSQDEAKKVIERAGLSADVSYVASTEDPGTVVGSEPKAGTVMDEGQSVALSVSSPYPPTVYTIKSYLTARPQDLSTYLTQEGYHMAYGAGKDDVATMTWTGAEAQPEVTIGPIPFRDYRGFQFWATDTLAAGAKVEGVRLTIDQKSAPSEVGTLKVDQSTITKLMGACGLAASSGTTTTATPSTIVPKPSDDSVEFEAKAATDGGNTWAIVVWRDGLGQVRADVVIAPTKTLNSNLEEQKIDLSTYDGNMANLAASLICYGE